MTDNHFTFAKHRILPVINIPQMEVALPLAKALLDGGLDVLEVTLRSECSLEAIRLIKDTYPQMQVGAGTVLDIETVDKAIEAGADFIVSPGYDEEVVDYCISRNILITPGCTSASEIQSAQKKGLQILKFFPAELSGGVEAIKLLSGPFPKLRFIPTGGINFDNLGKYLKNDKVAACGGSYMATAEQIKNRDFEGITAACKRAVDISKGLKETNSKPVIQADLVDKNQRANIQSNTESKMKKVVGFGDYLLRLNPMGYMKFIQSPNWEANFTGAEANVCVSLACMGVETEFVTRLPDNEISRCGVAALNKYRVKTDHIAQGGDRVGIFYVEKGASQRPSKVIYDRMNSGFTSCETKDYNWDAIFEGAGFFHFTGITPALGQGVAKVCLDACKMAKERGITISCDLNYRKNLWTTAQAKSTMEELLAYVDVLIANEEDAEKVLGISAPDTDVMAGQLNKDGYIYVAQQISEKYNIPTVAITLRQSISASDNNWSGLLYTNQTPYFSKEYAVHLVDRVGGGDSFGAGLLYAIGHNYAPQESIEYAVAASCLKQTMEWDVNLSTKEEIMALVNGDGTGRVQR